MAAAARVRRFGAKLFACARHGALGSAAAMLLPLVSVAFLACGAAGCAERGGGAPGGHGDGRTAGEASPRYAAERSDIAVIDSPEGSTSGVDAYNAVVQAFGSARRLGPEAPAAALAESRVLLITSAVAGDERLFAACRAAVDSGAAAIVSSTRIHDERIPRRWRDLAASEERVIVLEDDTHATGRNVVADLEPLQPLPRLLGYPAGFDGFSLPVVVGAARELSALETPLAPMLAPAPSGAAIGFSACVSDPSVDHRDLEALRRLGAEIGVAIAGAGGASGANTSDITETISPDAWARFDATREAMRRMGATDAELAFAFAPALLAPSEYRRLAESGVRLLTIPHEAARADRPFEPADERGRFTALVVIPCTDASLLASEPDQLAQSLSRDASDSTWVTRVETYSRFWEARARSPLTSHWDGSRLRIDVDALIDLLVVAIPRAAGGKRLVEVLKDGASVPAGRRSEGGAEAMPMAEIPLARGKNTIWAVYE